MAIATISVEKAPLLFQLSVNAESPLSTVLFSLVVLRGQEAIARDLIRYTGNIYGHLVEDSLTQVDLSHIAASLSRQGFEVQVEQGGELIITETRVLPRGATT